MTAKQYLRQAYRLNELINSDLEEVTELRELSKCIQGTNLTGMPGSKTRRQDPPFVKCVDKIVDLERKIDAEIDRYVELKDEIRKAINFLDNNNERLLLRYRYIEFLTWEQISEKMGISIRTVHRTHARALRNLKY